MNDLDHHQTEPTVLFEDNQATIAISQSSKSYSKMKHIDIYYNFVREKILDGTVELRYCPTNDMLVDVLYQKD